MCKTLITRMVLTAFAVHCLSIDGVIGGADAVTGAVPSIREKATIVNVALFEPIESVAGVEWPKLANGEPDAARSAAVFAPCRLVYRRGTHEIFSMDATNIFLDQNQHLVTDIIVRPEWEPMPMAALVERLDDMLQQWGVQRQGVAARDLALWKKTNPAAGGAGILSPYSTGMRFDEMSDIFIEVHPLQDQGWYATIEIGARPELTLLLDEVSEHELVKIKPLRISLGQHVRTIFAASKVPPTTWPSRSDGTPESSVGVGFRVLCIEQGGTRVLVPVASASLDQTDARVAGISFIPLWKPARIRAVSDRLQHALMEWGIHLNQKNQADVEQWSKLPPIPSSFDTQNGTTIAQDDGGSITITVRAIPGCGYYTSFAIAAPNQKPN